MVRAFVLSDANGLAVISKKAGTTPGLFSMRLYLNHCARIINIIECTQRIEVGAVIVSGQIVAP